MRRRRIWSCLLLPFLLSATTPAPPANAGAIEQLEAATGQKIDRPGRGSAPAYERDPDAPTPDITNAPIFMAPAGIVGGVFMGGAWYFKEMAGKHPKKSFLKSYSEDVSIGKESLGASGAFNFGSHIGALPWLALYVPTWPIRQGIVAVADYASRPSPPPPPPKPDPNHAVYRAIADSYASLKAQAGVELGKAGGDVSAAGMRRDRYLDGFVNDRAELRAIRDSEGAAAARARAEKILDAWSRARREKAKVAATIDREIREKDAAIRKAAGKVAFAGLFIDDRLDHAEGSIERMLEDPSLPKDVAESLEREKKLAKLAGNAKTAYDVAGDVKEIGASFLRARREGKERLDWLQEPETEESLLRLNLKLLTVPKLAKPLASTAGSLELLADSSYALATRVVLGGQIEEGREQIRKLSTAAVFQDAAADEWNAVNARLEASREREQLIRQRHDRYANLAKENEGHAARYRR